MKENTFNKKDVEQVINFLNFIATKAHFKDWKTEDSVAHYRHLNFMQTVLLPKMEANVLEIIEVKDKKEEKGPKK